MAQETGAQIVPIAVEQYGSTFYFNVGENYTIPADSEKSADELNSELRDKLATLKWEIIEKQSGCQREQIPDNYLEDFQAEIIGRCNYGYGFSLEDALREAFHDKRISIPEEIFSHLNTLIPCKENAFLFRKNR